MRALGDTTPWHGDHDAIKTPDEAETKGESLDELAELLQSTEPTRMRAGQEGSKQRQEGTPSSPDDFLPSLPHLPAETDVKLEGDALRRFNQLVRPLERIGDGREPRALYGDGREWCGRAFLENRKAFEYLVRKAAAAFEVGECRTPLGLLCGWCRDRLDERYAELLGETAA